MKIQRFITADMRSAIRTVRETFGPDGVILSTRRTDEGLEVNGAAYPEFSPAIPAEQVNLLQVARALLVAHR